MARKPNPAPTTRRRRRARPSRRIAAIGLLGTGLYATGLPAVADAQAPVAAVSPAATPTPTPEPPAATPTPTPTPEPPAATPTPTPTPEPPAATPTPTPEPAPTPVPDTHAGATRGDSHDGGHHDARARRLLACRPSPRLRASGPPRPTRMRAWTGRPGASAGRTPRQARASDRRNPAPARRKHAPGRPADRPTGTDSAPAPTRRQRSRSPARSGRRSPGRSLPSASRASSSTSSGSRRSCCPIYQAAGMQYGVRWEVLAAINEIETDYGRNLNVSSAGATGWMQFMPATWADLRRRRQPRRPQGPVQPGRRDLCRRPLSARRRRRPRHSRSGVRVQPCGLVRRLGAEARAVDRRPAERSRGLAHRARAGPLPGARRGQRCRSDARARCRDRRARRRARDRGQRRPDRPDRPVAAARPARPARETSTATPTPTPASVRLSVRTRRRIRARPGPVSRGSRARRHVASTRPAAPSRSSSGCSRTRRARRRRPLSSATPPARRRPAPTRRTTGRCR